MRWAAGALLAIFVLQMVTASGLKSPTFDETGDIAAGVSYLQTRSVWLNLQHPPLLKEWMALPVWAGGARLPGQAQQQGGEREAGADLIRANGPDRTLWLARLPMIALSAMLGWILWLWGRELVGERAALCGLFLFALDPNLVAHGYLATTDVGFAAFALLFLYVLWRRSHWALCGVALGLALASKFTAVFLVPIAAGLMLAEGRKWKETARDLLLMGVVASLVVQALYFSPSGLYLYTAGLGMVNRDHNPDYLVFMAGEFDHRFTSYFLVAWMLKTPLATLLSVAAGIWFVLRGKDISRRAKLNLFIPPVVLFLVYTLLADDLGIRYILPVLPFLFLVGGVALTRMPRAVAGVLCVWLLVAAIGIWPDHLSYFNEAACLLRDPSKIGFDGGTRCGRYWLDDSNVDWGQGYKQLRAWMEQHGGGRTIKLAGFDSFPATAYGFPVQPLGPTGLPAKPEPGLWAASAHVVARATGSWLQTVEPTAIVGHAIYVWDLK